MTVRREILFEGRVQGVGFRATTAEIARRYDVSGTVRNLPDGRVELIVEGKPDDIDTFLSDLRQHMSRFIAAEHCTESPTSGSFDGFRIVY